MRDLCRARQAAVEALRRARQQVSGFLLRLKNALAAQVDPEQTVEDGWVRRWGEHLETSNNRVLARRM